MKTVFRVSPGAGCEPPPPAAAVDAGPAASIRTADESFPPQATVSSAPASSRTTSDRTRGDVEGRRRTASLIDDHQRHRHQVHYIRLAHQTAVLRILLVEQLDARAYHVIVADYTVPLVVLERRRPEAVRVDHRFNPFRRADSRLALQHIRPKLMHNEDLVRQPVLDHQPLQQTL